MSPLSGGKDTLISKKDKSAKLSLKSKIKQTFGNRRSMNDLKQNNKSKPLNVLTSNFVDDNIDSQLILIQKFMRGHKAYKECKILKDSSSKHNKVLLNKMNSSSSGTFERATNQNDILKGMMYERKNDSADDSASEIQRIPARPKEEIKVDIRPKLKLLHK